MPKSQVEFLVRTERRFPLDMLRYDACWPAKPDDVRLMARLLFNELLPDHTHTQIRMHGLRCTPERWATFGCEIIEQRGIG